MKRYEHIFLDLDGPVLDGKQKHYQCYKDIVTRMGGCPIDIESYWGEKRKGNNRELILRYSGLESPDKYDMFMAEWKEKIERKAYLQFDVLKPRMQEVLRKLKTNTEELILVTMRNNEKNLIWEIERFGIFNFFDKLIVCKSGDMNSKYIEISRRILPSMMEKSVVIGDTEIDIFTAKRMGAEFIGIINGLRTADLFKGMEAYEEMADFCK